MESDEIPTTGGPSYWIVARIWARAHTKTYTLPKAVPPVLAALLQLFVLHMRPLGSNCFSNRRHRWRVSAALRFGVRPEPAIPCPCGP